MERLNKDLNYLEELIQKKDLYKANKLADHLLAKDTSDLRILTLSARAKLFSDNLKEAKWLAEMVCVKHNYTIEVGHILGLCHQKLGEYKEAAEAYRQIIGKVPQSAFAHFQLGEALAHGGKKDESIQAYQKAAELDHDGDIGSMAESKIIRIKEDIGQDLQNER